jgi:hypothetical protein
MGCMLDCAGRKPLLVVQLPHCVACCALLCAYLHCWQAACEVEPRWVHQLALCFDHHCTWASHISQQECAEIVDDPSLIAATAQSDHVATVTVGRPGCLSVCCTCRTCLQVSPWRMPQDGHPCRQAAFDDGSAAQQANCTAAGCPYQSRSVSK